MTCEPEHGDLEQKVREIEREISELKQRDEKLRENEWVLNQAQNIACIGSWYMDLQTGESGLSDELSAIYGVDRDFDCTAKNIIGTLIHLLKFDLPELDSAGRPTMFYSRIIHDQCPRFSDYERERFAATFSDEGYLFKLGCLGPTTHADCTLRLWNGRTNYCIKASAPCIGCTSPDFALKTSFPFYTKEPAV